jgi:hypothetical protein
VVVSHSRSRMPDATREVNGACDRLQVPPRAWVPVHAKSGRPAAGSGRGPGSGSGSGAGSGTGSSSGSGSGPRNRRPATDGRCRFGLEPDPVRDASEASPERATASPDDNAKLSTQAERALNANWTVRRRCQSFQRAATAEGAGS